MRRNSSKLHLSLIIATWGYFVVLWLCLILKFVFKDQWWWLGFLNSFTLYWFAPLLLFGSLAIYLQGKTLKIVSLLSFCFFIILFGQLLVPKWYVPKPTESTITIMTYNLYGENRNWDVIRRTISESDADVIALQELNSEMAMMIQTELSESYSYQIVDSQDSVISRFPVTLTETTLPDSWGSPPQVYQIKVNEVFVTLLNSHFYASLPNSDFDFMQWVFREREHQAQLVVEFAEQVETPLIVTADFNATDQSYAYQLITQQLDDSWREAGWGFGHTFPGGAIPSLSRPKIAGYFIPMWVARIDYIFYSHDWRAIDARLGLWDGISDHRPVITALTLLED